MVGWIVFVAIFAVILIADRSRAAPPAELASPEVGDLTVLRIALDVAAIAELPAETTLQRAACS